MGDKRICKGHFLVPADCECKYLAQIPTTRVDLSAKDERSWLSFTKTLANEVQAADQGGVIFTVPVATWLTPFSFQSAHPCLVVPVMHLPGRLLCRTMLTFWQCHAGIADVLS